MNQVILYWAAMAYWDFSDIILLSIGFDPKGDTGVIADDDTAKTIGFEWERRYELLKRASALNQTRTVKLPIEGPEEGSSLYGFPPLEASKWAMENFPSFPPKLYEAVLSRNSANGLGNQLKSLENAESLPVSPFIQKPETNRGDQSGMPSSCIKSSEAALQMTDKRWGLNRQMKDLIKNYVEAEAIKPNCLCLANHMLDIITDLESPDGTMLIDTKILSEKAALKYIKTLYADNKIHRTCKGHPPKNACQLHVNKS
jgi:hypothetical protein